MPLATPRTSSITRLDQLADAFFTFLDGQIAAGRNAPDTLKYYRRYIDEWIATLPAEFPIVDLRTHHLSALGGLSFHRVQPVKRLFRWAKKQGMIAENPFADVELPPCGRRERILDLEESTALLKGSDPRRKSQPVSPRGPGAPWRPLRWLFVAMAHTLVRPGEIRKLRWRDYDERTAQFSITEYKGKKRRKHNKATRRIVPVDPFLAKILALWKRRRSPRPDEHIFLRWNGRPWTKDGLCTEVRRACRRAKLDLDGEPVVAYTQRHTGATRAARPLDPEVQGATIIEVAAVLGNSIRMAERYVHVSGDLLTRVAAKAQARPRRLGVST